MEKYTTTDKNQIIRTGKTIHVNKANKITVNGIILGMPRTALITWIEQDWIKPIEKSEFTKSDMIDFLRSYGYDDEFYDWIKSKDK